VKAEPAELEPGAAVHYGALVASASGSVDGAPLEWAFCSTPKPLGENNSVSPACLGDEVRPIGVGPAIDTTVPPDACTLFGSETTGTALRPRDPDATGGYYQPVRVVLDGVPAVMLTRIACDLRNAPLDVVREHTRRYRPNANPRLISLSAFVAGVPTELERIPAGALVELVAELDPGSAEAFVMFDSATQSLVDRRETLRVSWLVSGGELDVPRSPAAGEPLEATNRFRAPNTPGTVALWVVARDGRGGVDYWAGQLAIGN
jgi:hypothetical protein